jgi:DHA3 family macrolide efflux protein-like MFS transporter
VLQEIPPKREDDVNQDHQDQPQSMRPFFVIWGGQAFSLIGSQLVQFALVWWMTKTTGSATVLATATLVALLPQIFLSPIAGALIDRWNRRRVMMVADGLIALATVLLALLYAFDLAQVWHIYVLMFVRSVGGAFHWPAMQASTTLMVPQKHLSRVAGLNQALFGLVNIVSPPLGALLLEILPMQGILSIDVGTAILAITPLFFVHIPQPERKQAPEAPGAPSSVLADMREGLGFVWGWPGLMLILLIATVLNMLVNPAFSLLPIMVTDHFKGGALQLAWLESAWGIGMVLGGITLSVWGGFKRRVVTAMLAITLMGVGVTVLGLTPASLLGLAVGALFFSGFMNPIANGSFFATVQSTVPPEMQGRVFTLAMSGSAAMSPLGLAVAGPVADAVGVQIWFLVGGVVTILLGVGSFFVPAILNLEDGVTDAMVDDTGKRMVASVQERQVEVAPSVTAQV